MKVSYSWLQSLIEGKLPQAEELADLLSTRSFETSYLGGDILEIDILPNRAHDCLGHWGVAREAAAVLGLSLKKTDYARKLKEKENIKQYLRVKVEDKDLCSRYTGRVILNVQLGESPEWIKGRLLACGLRPINNIVDIANYVMLETGQPLHSFDWDKVAQKTIVVRRAKAGEKIITLEKENYDLDKDVLLIADPEKPLCIAGIKGGQSPEIDEQTKNIILEAANFQASSIRRTSRKLKLSTDASYRFERELDPNLTKEAIDLAAFLIQEVAGGRVVKGLADVYPQKIGGKVIGLRKEQVDRLLGIDISAKEIKNILTRLGFKVQGTEKMKVTVPTQRLDVSLPEDLIEEIGRLYGYEKIASQFPLAALISPVRNKELVYQNKTRDILSGLGFDEVYNYSLLGDAEIGSREDKSDLVELANPLNCGQKYLRPSLIPSLLKNVKENRKYFDEVKIFEIGRVFLPEETVKLGVAFSAPDGFYALKGVLDLLFNKLGISGQRYSDASAAGATNFCQSAKKAEIKIGNNCLGWLGEIDGTTVFELDFEKLAELATEEKIYLPPSKYPAMIRDVAVLVEPKTKMAEVLERIKSAGEDLIKEISFFDVYEEKEIKSFAFHIIYQSNDRNLTDEEVNEAHKKIINALEAKDNWKVRK